MITEEQRQARKLGIGGSDMAIILGLSSYKTPYQLFLEKTGVIESSQEETPWQYWGNALEPVVRDEFAKRNNVTVELPETIVHPFYEFMRGNVDGYIKEWNAVLEIKCSSSFMAQEWGDADSDVIPMAYLVQVAHYCACLNADSAHIAVLIGGNDYREYKYIRDEELENTVVNAAKAFWNSVVKDIAPPASTIPDLKLMFPKHHPDKTKSIDDTSFSVLQELHATKEKIKELEEIEEESKFKLMEYMEDCECLVDAEGRPLATWKSNKRGTRTLLLKSAKE